SDSDLLSNGPQTLQQTRTKSACPRSSLRNRGVAPAAKSYDSYRNASEMELLDFDRRQPREQGQGNHSASRVASRNSSRSASHQLVYCPTCLIDCRIRVSCSGGIGICDRYPPKSLTPYHVRALIFRPIGVK